MLLAAVLMMALLAGCVGPEEEQVGLPISEEEAQEFKQAYWERMSVEPYASSPDELTVRLLGRFGENEDILVGYVDGYLLRAPIGSMERFGAHEIQHPHTNRLFVYYEGAVYPIAEARSMGILDDEATDTIYANAMQWMPQDPEPPVLEERVLPEQEQQMLRERYAEGSSYPVDNFVLHYFGRYGDTYAVLMENIWQETFMGFTGLYWQDCVEGIEFRGKFTWSGLGIYYNGIFYTLQEAYDNGYLTMEDLVDLQIYYHWAESGIFEGEPDIYWYDRPVA